MNWFLNLGFSNKCLFIASIGWLLTYQFMSLKLSYSNSEVLSLIAKEKKALKESILINDQLQDSIVSKGKYVTLKVQKSIKYINLKSKENAKKIDDSDYPISKLDSLLSSYD